MTEKLSVEAKAQLDEFKTQRAYTKGCITRIKTYISGKGESLTAADLECRLGILESYWKLVISHQISIEKIVPYDTSNETTRSELEDLYCEVKSTIISLMPAHNRRSISENSSFMISTISKPAANLPPLKLPQFSGRYSDFPNFIATFNKLVHDDADKSVTEKYNHLYNCLVGPARRTIESLGKSADNYVEALKILKERYDNKCLIFQEHIAELFELPKVSKGSSEQLRNLVDKVSAHLSALRVLGSDTDIINSIIIYLVNSKLDSDSQAKWDESIDYSKFPTWSECETVLSRRCQFLETRDKRLQPQSSESISCIKSSRKHQTSRGFRNSTSLKITATT